MQALRLARPIASLRVVSPRCLATAAASAAPPSSSSSSPTIIPLSNVEAQWSNMGHEEQLAVYQQIEELQKKDWKQLSIDEKKAAYYVSFGPHGPRAPINPPGTSLKVVVGVAGLIAATGVVSLIARAYGSPPPKTITKEWQEASNERAREMKLNPISGISSEDYKGTGFVTK